LGYYTVLDFLVLEDGTDTLSWNVGKGLPLNAAQYSRRAQIWRLFLFNLVKNI
jgi:hypothetical protein